MNGYVIMVAFDHRDAPITATWKIVARRLQKKIGDEPIVELMKDYLENK